MIKMTRMTRKNALRLRRIDLKAGVTWSEIFVKPVDGRVTHVLTHGMCKSFLRNELHPTRSNKLFIKSLMASKAST